MRPRIRIAVVAGVVVAAMSLTGCLSLLRTGQAVVSPSDMSTKAPAPLLRGTPAIVLAAGTLVGTGTLQSTTRGASHGFEIYARENAQYQIEFPGYRPSTGLEVLGSVTEADPNSGCDDSAETELDLGPLLAGTEVPVSMGDNGNSFPRGDPSFIRSLLLVQVDRGATECPIGVVLTGNVSWQLPNMNPGLRAFDFGPRPGARGEVTAVDGIPSSYRPDPLDSPGAVAERMGLTVEDLEWLNPLEAAFGRVVTQGQDINLDPTQR